MRRGLCLGSAVGLALLGAGILGTRCDPQTADWIEEQARRQIEGRVRTPEARAAVAAHIGALVESMGGAVAGSLADRMAARAVPGVSVAVVHRGRVEWVEAFGVRDVASGAPMLRSSLLQAASISKPVTAIALLQLVEQGVLELEAPLNDALTSWQYRDTQGEPVAAVTLRRVLSHSSGTNNSGYVGYFPPAPVPTLFEVLEGLAPATSPAVRVVETPGVRFRYSGGAYTGLQQFVRDVTGRDFATWVKDHVLSRARMDRSRFEQPLLDPEGRGAAIPSFNGVAFPIVTYPELPAAGLWSTSLDLARLVVAIQDALAGRPRALLGPEIAAAMVTPQTPAPTLLDIGFPGGGMGLGLFTAGGDPPGWFWHTGSNAGFMCVLVGDTSGAGLGAAVMTNGSFGGRLLAWEIVNAIADLYSWPGGL
ncbi:MAG: serine hydrolase domain-containing protein [Myxococcota bacterium]|nr:serine hydrolase domain-containing protein [Myxococcota bacterium]